MLGPSPVFDCSVSLKEFARAARLVYVRASGKPPFFFPGKSLMEFDNVLHPVFGEFGVISRSHNDVNLGVGLFGFM